MIMSLRSFAVAALFAAAAAKAMAEPALPKAIGAAGRPVMTLHGVGAQIYDCKLGADGRLAWQFREPVATLVGTDGSTRGRHYAGPTWELADGSAIVGKPIAHSPGRTPADIPWLKLEVVSSRGSGALDRLNEALACAARALGGRAAEPTAAIIDSQSVKTTEAGGPRGGACRRAGQRPDPMDAGKKIKGRKRHIVTDTQGHMLTGIVREASLQDRDGAPRLIGFARESFPTVTHAFADSG